MILASNLIQLEPNGLEGNSNFQIQVKKGSRTGSKESTRQITKSDFISNIDTALFRRVAQEKFPLNIRVKEITTNVPKPMLTFLVENPSTKDSAWSPG